MRGRPSLRASTSRDCCQGTVRLLSGACQVSSGINQRLVPERSHEWEPGSSAKSGSTHLPWPQSHRTKPMGNSILYRRRACVQWGQPLVVTTTQQQRWRGCPRTCGQRHQGVSTRHQRSRRCPVRWGQPTLWRFILLEEVPGCPQRTSGPALCIGRLVRADGERRSAQEFSTIGVSFLLTRSARPGLPLGGGRRPAGHVHRAAR